MLKKLRLFDQEDHVGLESQATDPASDMVIYQVMAQELPLELDIVFESASFDAQRQGKEYQLSLVLLVGNYDNENAFLCGFCFNVNEVSSPRQPKT